MPFDITLWVVCGNIAEFEQYVKLKFKSTSEIISQYRYLFGTANLHGLSEVHGVFYGSWRQREDIDDIIKYDRLTVWNTDEIVVDASNAPVASAASPVNTYIGNDVDLLNVSNTDIS